MPQQATQFGRTIAAPNDAWLAEQPREAVLDPSLPIIDTHHHFWDRRDHRYLLDQLNADLATGHNIVAELREFGITALVTDPLADPAEAKHEYGVELVPLEHFTKLDGLILAVPHRVLAEGGWDKLFAALALGGVFVDVKSVVARDRVPQGTHYWSL